MKIDVRSENCVYIYFDGFWVYIDNSTGEEIIEYFPDPGAGSDLAGKVLHSRDQKKGKVTSAL